MITFPSYAKVNLALDVLGKDASGYHQIRSIMMPISLADTLKISSGGASGIELKTTGIACPQGKKNIVVLAAQAFFSAAGIKDPAIKIHLHKRIPLASGLGGGSSNAATTLLALNHLYGAPLSQKRLHALAIQLGMDVPFFLNPRLSLATHFGEKITIIKRLTKKLPAITLLFPKTKKRSTKNQYTRLDLSLCGQQKSSTTTLLRHLKTSPKTWDTSWNSLLHNDFDQLYKKPLRTEPQSTHLSGSGPARFTIHPTS